MSVHATPKTKEIAFETLVSEYQALGASIRDYLSTSVQVASAFVGIAAVAAGASFANSFRSILLVLPFVWAIFGLTAARLYREVLSMGADRAEIERRLATDFAEFDVGLSWETVVASKVLHKRSYAWAENSLFVILFITIDAIAARIAWDVDGKVAQNGLEGFRWMYLIFVIVMTVVVLRSIMRGIGIFAVTRKALEAHSQQRSRPD